MAAARSGERAAFADLVRLHTPKAHATAVLLGAGAEADDIVQEAFVKAYRGLGGFRDGSPFRPWLLRIVANETRNLHRATGRRRQREQTVAGSDALLPRLVDTADPADQAISRDRQEYLRSELLKLPESQRAVIICRYLIDLDEAETATVLGIARGTVKSRTHRALDRLRGAMAGDVGAVRLGGGP
ncbi:RNA polymerase sigma factor [Nakamurella sp. GG22]